MTEYGMGEGKAPRLMVRVVRVNYFEKGAEVVVSYLNDSSHESMMFGATPDEAEWWRARIGKEVALVFVAEDT